MRVKLCFTKGMKDHRSHAVWRNTTSLKEVLPRQRDCFAGSFQVRQGVVGKKVLFWLCGGVLYWCYDLPLATGLYVGMRVNMQIRHPEMHIKNACGSKRSAF